MHQGYKLGFQKMYRPLKLEQDYYLGAMHNTKKKNQ